MFFFYCCALFMSEYAPWQFSLSVKLCCWKKNYVPLVKRKFMFLYEKIKVIKFWKFMNIFKISKLI